MFWAIFSMLSTITSSAQKILEVPFKYTRAGDSTTLEKTNNLFVFKKKTRQLWVVFSDRKYNRTFTEKNCQTVLKSLDFLDVFYVINETQDAIHIYRDPDPGTSLSKGAEDFGWIKKEQILLWRRPLVNNQDSYRKAILLNKAEELQKAMIKGRDSLVRFYKDPNLVVQNEKVADPLSIFYIYKFFPSALNPKSALIGARTIINASTAKDDIWGWVGFNMLSTWDYRVAVLPNSDEAAVNERQNKKIRSSIFCTEKEARNYAAGKAVDSSCIRWDNDRYSKSFPGSRMRFPVLSDLDKKDSSNSEMQIGFINQADGGRILLDLLTFSKYV